MRGTLGGTGSPQGSPQDGCKCPPNPSSTCCSGPAPEMARCRGCPRPQGHPGCTASPCVPDGSAGPGGAARAESWGPGMASRCQGLIGASSPPFPKWRSTATVQLGRSQADRVLGTGAHAARPSPPSPPDRSPRARQPSSAAWGLANGGVAVQSLCGAPGGPRGRGGRRDLPGRGAGPSSRPPCSDSGLGQGRVAAP